MPSERSRVSSHAPVFTRRYPCFGKGGPAAVGRLPRGPPSGLVRAPVGGVPTACSQTCLPEPDNSSLPCLRPCGTARANSSTPCLGYCRNVTAEIPLVPSAEAEPGEVEDADGEDVEEFGTEEDVTVTLLREFGIGYEAPPSVWWMPDAFANPCGPTPDPGFPFGWDVNASRRADDVLRGHVRLLCDLASVAPSPVAWVLGAIANRVMLLLAVLAFIPPAAPIVVSAYVPSASTRDSRIHHGLAGVLLGFAVSPQPKGF